jgi:NAD(P)-dependent dehydrogenase (short-subunit alcohol dehydrogenase family)
MICRPLRQCHWPHGCGHPQAGIYSTASRVATPEGHGSILAVNTLAPYTLTEQLGRVIYLSSMQWAKRAPCATLTGWSGAGTLRAYSESKLDVAALAFAVARRCPDVLSNAVDLGWVPTRMGGPGAPDDLELRHLIQTWLAVSDESATMVSGRYWQHRQQQAPAREVTNSGFQDQLITRLAALSSISLF